MIRDIIFGLVIAGILWFWLKMDPIFSFILGAVGFVGLRTTHKITKKAFEGKSSNQ